MFSFHLEVINQIVGTMIAYQGLKTNDIENKDLLGSTDRFDLEPFDLEHFEKVVTIKRSSITIYGFKGRVDFSKIGFLQFVRGSF